MAVRTDIAVAPGGRPLGALSPGAVTDYPDFKKVQRQQSTRRLNVCKERPALDGAYVYSIRTPPIAMATFAALRSGGKLIGISHRIAAAFACAGRVRVSPAVAVACAG